MSAMGFDPRKLYSGRSPLEAVSLGIDMADDDVSFRVNLVTLSEEKISQIVRWSTTLPVRLPFRISTSHS